MTWIVCIYFTNHNSAHLWLWISAKNYWNHYSGPDRSFVLFAVNFTHVHLFILPESFFFDDIVVGRIALFLFLDDVEMLLEIFHSANPAANLLDGSVQNKVTFLLLTAVGNASGFQKNLHLLL